MGVIWSPPLDAEQERWRARALDVAEQHFRPIAADLDREQRYPWESVERLVDSGLAGLFLPREEGGQGAALTTAAAVTEAVSSVCASSAAILCAYQLGAFPILLAGTPEQKRFYLSAMAAGTATSFALSERATGSDAAAIAATAVPEGDGWRIRGEKYWIGNGGASRYYVVFAKTDPEAGGRGISAFMVDGEAEGVAVTEYCDKMGIRGTTTSNLELDTWVPADAMVGPRDRALKLAFQTLNVGRIMVSAQSTGLALAAYHEAARRSVDRRTFGQPIGENQGIGFKLADMVTQISAARMMLYEAASAYDRGQSVAELGAMAKLFTSEVAHMAADTAVQVWGGFGYIKPSTVERLYRDQRILEIYEGTSEIQRLVLGRAVKKEAESWLADADRGSGAAAGG
jgi:alkylation response protein AidB-like acyl-CoA dehydrogenase